MATSKNTPTLPASRFLVPDLSPRDRTELKDLKPLWVFVAESPHVSEVEPENQMDRRPLCGMAGRQWWDLLSQTLENRPNSDVSLKHLLQFCKKHRIAVMNAVQYPLDPKVSRLFPDANPIKNLGFSKEAGADSFKKKKDSIVVRQAVESLRLRLTHSSVASAKIYCLGNDSQWFVSRALENSDAVSRLEEKIPHPSAWWRKGGLYGRIAHTRLSEIFIHGGASKSETDLASQL